MKTAIYLNYSTLIKGKNLVYILLFKYVEIDNNVQVKDYWRCIIYGSENNLSFDFHNSSSSSTNNMRSDIRHYENQNYKLCGHNENVPSQELIDRAQKDLNLFVRLVS
jgi:hypothetical protein